MRPFLCQLKRLTGEIIISPGIPCWGEKGLKVGDWSDRSARETGTQATQMTMTSWTRPFLGQLNYANLLPSYLNLTHELGVTEPLFPLPSVATLTKPPFSLLCF